MFTSNDNPVVRRVSAFVSAAVTLLVMAMVFVAFNWDHTPKGLADFLAMRITMKNLLVATICVTGSAWAFHVFGLTRPALNTSWLDDTVQVTKACLLAAAFGALFPLTSHTGRFTLTALLMVLPTTIVA